MSERIKITNIATHAHTVQIPNRLSGIPTPKRITPKNSIVVDADQFIEMFNSDGAFDQGILSFEPDSIPQDVLEILGIENKEDLDLGIVSYDEKKIKEVLTSKVAEFDKFLAEIDELEPITKLEFSKKVFQIAVDMKDKLSGAKLDKIELATGIEFANNKE